jgi:RNA polymerase-binding transcription factor
MTEQDIDLIYFEELLNERLAEINELTEVGDNAAQPVELDQTRVGRLSRMDAMQAQAMSVEAKRRREIESVRISAALKRVEAGTYGECLECSEMILIARLEFNPSMPLCIQCAERKEQ